MSEPIAYFLYINRWDEIKVVNIYDMGEFEEAVSSITGILVSGQGVKFEEVTYSKG